MYPLNLVYTTLLVMQTQKSYLTKKLETDFYTIAILHAQFSICEQLTNKSQVTVSCKKGKLLFSIKGGF